MENYLILRAGRNFRLGSGISVEHEAEIFSNLCTFFKDNDLFAFPLEFPVETWEGFELRANNFTEQGLAVVKCGLDKWLRSLDRGKTATDTSVLKKCLRNILAS